MAASAMLSSRRFQIPEFRFHKYDSSNSYACAIERLESSCIVLLDIILLGPKAGKVFLFGVIIVHRIVGKLLPATNNLQAYWISIC